MATIHPGSETELGSGDRLGVVLSGSHAGEVALTLTSVTGGITIKTPRGRWVVHGDPGAEGTLAVSAPLGSAMQGTVGLAITPPGTPSTSWEVPDVPVDGRGSVPVLRLTRGDDGIWLARSLVAPPRPAEPTTGLGVETRRSPDPVIIDDLVQRNVLIALDGSASLGWAIDQGTVLQIVEQLQTATRQVLDAHSSVHWCTFGTGASPAAPVASGRHAPAELVQALRPELFSSGAALSEVTPLLTGGEALIVLTDSWLDPVAVTEIQSRDVQVCAVLLGMAEPGSWPQDWRDQSELAARAGVHTITVGREIRGSEVQRWAVEVLSGRAGTRPQAGRADR